WVLRHPGDRSADRLRARHLPGGAATPRHHPGDAEHTLGPGRRRTLDRDRVPDRPADRRRLAGRRAVADLSPAQSSVARAACEAISSTTSWLARVVTSPSLRFSEMSFRRRRMILPDRVLGRSSVNTIEAGLAIGPIV